MKTIQLAPFVFLFSMASATGLDLNEYKSLIDSCDFELRKRLKKEKMEFTYAYVYKGKDRANVMLSIGVNGQEFHPRSQDFRTIGACSFELSTARKVPNYLSYKGKEYILSYDQSILNWPGEKEQISVALFRNEDNEYFLKGYKLRPLEKIDQLNN